MWAYVLSAFVTAFIGFWFWHAAIPGLKGMAGTFDTHDLLKTGTPILWIALMHLVNAWADTITLGIFHSETDVGIYNVALRTSMLTNFILVVVNSIVSPNVASLCYSWDYIKMSRIIISSTRIVILFFSKSKNQLLFLAANIYNGIKVDSVEMENDA